MQSCVGAGERSNREPKPAVWVGRRQPAKKESKIEDFGAVDRKNIEPNQLNDILQELEDWQAYIEAEPEIVRRLEAFQTAAISGAPPAKQTSNRKRRTGPSL